MRLITDWHIHSKYSRACSSRLTLPEIARACEKKGIDVVATSDWTHPAWFAHLEEMLEEASPGIYTLKDHSSPTRFMLVTEVSQIYKRDGKTRRIHNLVFSPSLETCRKVNAELDRREFNRRSDGRPIFGMDSEDFYVQLKEIDERIILVPAHAWTPWYSVFGSKSGFDALEECFGKMTPYIHAIETGLSSDPKMNWQVSGLDSVALISNSDAHSLEKLGREANVFDLSDVSYDGFVSVLKTRDPKRFVETIEFFPEEGKYHLDGCADCKFSSAPKETKRLGGHCPSCGKLLTLGVEYRVADLADREPVPNGHVPYRSIVPLVEVIGDVFAQGVSSKKVLAEYEQLLAKVGSEFYLLLDAPIEEIMHATSDSRIAEAIRHMRAGTVSVTPGYDGIFGTVKMFGSNDRPKKPQQTAIF